MERIIEEKTGFFLVMDGIGGCGKDTQTEYLAGLIRNMGREVVVTREHTRDTPPGELIEDIIKKRKPRIDPLALQLMYTCDRRNHYMKEILPALQEGAVVIGNRYYSTTVAYCPPEWRREILRINTEVVRRPNLVILLDLDPVEAAKRVEQRNDADIFDKAETLKRCREGYEWYRVNSKDRCDWVDANGSREEVFDRIKRMLRRRKVI